MVRILSQIHPSLMRKSGARVIRRLKMDQQSSAEHVEHPKKSLDNPGISDGSGRFAVDQMADEVSHVPAAVIPGGFCLAGGEVGSRGLDF
jgi:hypothetical protein